MRLCKNCSREFYETREDPTGKFPLLTVLGSILGGIATALTGTLILVPLGAIAGLGGDIATCEICGTDKDLYEVMEQREMDDRLVFFPYKDKDIEPRPPARTKLDQQTEAKSQAYVLDESGESLVSISGLDDGNQAISSIGWSIGEGFDIGGTEGGFSSGGDSSSGCGASGSEGGTGGDGGGGE